eukprot:TRINITY_DN4093_c0_g1_i1.p1 TRINITY_DN4093_c0_g1~~TRINITY_DN4093_c0_g1_i1.p1  ORF type:complete len:445 (+),score=57.48 TRINITY_DN4093_c0_g1_i1:74-1408(+)
MYPLRTYRVPCDSLIVEEPAESLPLVTVPELLKPSFVGLNHVPLYYFDYIGEVRASWKAVDRVGIVSSEQFAICELNGLVRRCVQISDITEIVVDQSEPKKLQHLRNFLRRRKKYTRVYIRTISGCNMLVHVVRDTPALLRALLSFSGAATVRVLSKATQFESSVDTKTLTKDSETLFRTPSRSYITEPELLERTLFKNIYERETRKLSMDASLTCLNRKSSRDLFRRSASFGSFLSRSSAATARSNSSVCASCRRVSMMSATDSWDRRYSEPLRSSGHRVQFKEATAAGRPRAEAPAHDLRSALRHIPKVTKPVLNFEFPPVCCSDGSLESDRDVAAASPPLTPETQREVTAAGAALIEKACEAAADVGQGEVEEQKQEADEHSRTAEVDRLCQSLELKTPSDESSEVPSTPPGTPFRTVQELPSNGHPSPEPFSPQETVAVE